MPERWRRELRRLSSLTPSDDLFRQAGQGSRGGPEPGRSRSGLVAVVVVTTNLPEGTRVEISTTDEGSCCPQVEGGRIVVETEDSSCYGPVGHAANSTGFEATVTARPDLDTLVFPGPVMPGPGGGSGV